MSGTKPNLEQNYAAVLLLYLITHELQMLLLPLALTDVYEPTTGMSKYQQVYWGAKGANPPSYTNTSTSTSTLEYKPRLCFDNL
jgi:hypothetical protein